MRINTSAVPKPFVAYDADPALHQPSPQLPIAARIHLSNAGQLQPDANLVPRPTETIEAMTSKRMFQTWRTVTKLPRLLAEARNTWLDLNPDFQYELLDDRFLGDWLTERISIIPFGLQATKPFIRSVDLFRYSYLYERGGLYADLDFVCVKPIAGLLQAYPTDAVLLGSVNLPERHVQHTIPNAWMYAGSAHHPFWLVVLALAEQRSDHDWVEYATGPILLRDAYCSFSECTSRGDILGLPGVSRLAGRMGATLPHSWPPVVILPPSLIYPLGWGFENDREVVLRFRSAASLSESLVSTVNITPDTYAYTFWYHSWEGDIGGRRMEGRTAEHISELEAG